MAQIAASDLTVPLQAKARKGVTGRRFPKIGFIGQDWQARK
jgi:hypothetical protein